MCESPRVVRPTLGGHTRHSRHIGTTGRAGTRVMNDARMMSTRGFRFGPPSLAFSFLRLQARKSVAVHDGSRIHVSLPLANGISNQRLRPDSQTVVAAESHLVPQIFFELVQSGLTARSLTASDPLARSSTCHFLARTIEGKTRTRQIKKEKRGGGDAGFMLTNIDPNC